MIRRFFSTTYNIIKNSFWEFIDDNAMTLAGALAYFAIFSIPPIFLIVLNGVAVFAGEEIASQELYGQINALWGEEPAQLIQDLIKNYKVSIGTQTIIHHAVGIGTFLVSSTSFFLVIQFSLNEIWRIKPKPKSTVVSILKNRLLSFTIILVLIIMILLSVILDSFLVLMQRWADILIPIEGVNTLLFGILGPLLSYLLVTLILGVILKYLSHAFIEWKIVWVGAAITSLFFGLGKLAIGFMIGNSDVEGTYGIVGSLILVLLWVYYSAIILFYGAEFTEQYAIARSKPIKPGKNAVKIIMQERDLDDETVLLEKRAEKSYEG